MDKKRQRTTKKQYEIIIGYLEENKDLMSFDKNLLNYNKTEEKWKKMSELLNYSQYGPEKTVKEWKNVVSEWKTNTKKKAREILNHGLGTGGGPSIKKKISDLEERLLALLNKIIIEGAPNVSEPGLVQEENQFDYINAIVSNNEINGEDIIVFSCDDVPPSDNSHAENNCQNYNISERESSGIEKPLPKRCKKLPPSNLEKAIELNTEIMQAFVVSNNNVANALNKISNSIDQFTETFKMFIDKQ